MPHQPPTELYWCTSHRREATHKKPDGSPCCDPKLSGILLPCHCVQYKINPAFVDGIPAGGGSSADQIKFLANLEIGHDMADDPSAQHSIPILYKRKPKCTSS